MEEKEKNIIRERNKKARRHPCLPTTDRGATQAGRAVGRDGEKAKKTNFFSIN